MLQNLFLTHILRPNILFSYNLPLVIHKLVIPDLFLSFLQLTDNLFNMEFCQSVDLNRGSLVLEATAIPTEPQPLTLIIHNLMGD